MTDMKLAALCKERGIDRVWIIDDAYSIKWPDEEAINIFISRVEENEQFESVAAMLGEAKAKIEDAGTFLSLMRRQETIKTLFDASNRPVELVPALDELFAEATRRLRETTSELTPLENFIEEQLDVKPETWSDGTLVMDQRPVASLIFIDYRLDADPRASQDDAVNKSIKLVQSIYGIATETSGSFEYRKPLVILITNLEPSIEHLQDFRDRAEVPGAKFRFIPKSRFHDTCKLEMLLFELINHMEQACLLEQFISQVKGALPQAQEEAVRMLKALDLSDYAYIHRFRLTEEGASLPAYILWLLGMFLQRQMEENEGLRAAAGHLDALEDSLSNGKIPPAHFEPTGKVAHLYQSAIYERTTRIDGDTPLQSLTDLRKKFAAIGMGDIFVPADASGCPVVVISQSCDIARPDLNTSLLLLTGRVIRRDSEKDAKILHDEKTRSHLFLYPPNHTSHDGDYIITWDLTHPLTYTIKSFYEEMPCDGGYARAWRLRAGYALKLQQEFAANLTRVGTPASPPYYRGLVGSVYIQTVTGKWELLFGFNEQHRFAYDLSARERENGKAKWLFRVVFLDAFVEKLRDCLSDLSRFQLTKAHRSLLTDFAQDARKLLSLLGVVEKR